MYMIEEYGRLFVTLNNEHRSMKPMLKRSLVLKGFNRAAILPLMPKGVEHTDTCTSGRVGSNAILPLMPKGVEHWSMASVSIKMGRRFSL